MDYWSKEIHIQNSILQVRKLKDLMRQITRQFILWYGLFETFVFTGNIFGWTALHYMLRQEGIYESVCESSQNVTAFAGGHNTTEVPSYNLKVSRNFAMRYIFIFNVF
ncbi:uncharacterized protein CDAR_296961 [Caerostris darwini]|uniref:Uncharacterized protein n=1 Tax=Caerostris darwini TaxID=1538125 RepID=A0AAV4N324_9ARAC|nr:uncharacterized protein CDAR_296961 [Caerostris darwini]